METPFSDPSFPKLFSGYERKRPIRRQRKTLPTAPWRGGGGGWSDIRREGECRIARRSKIYFVFVRGPHTTVGAKVFHSLVYSYFLVAFTFRDFPVRRLTCAGILLGISGAGYTPSYSLCLRLKREVTEANISCGTLHSSVVLRSQRRVRGENLASKPATTYVSNRTNASNERVERTNQDE